MVVIVYAFSIKSKHYRNQKGDMPHKYFLPLCLFFSPAHSIPLTVRKKERKKDDLNITGSVTNILPQKMKVLKEGLVQMSHFIIWGTFTSEKNYKNNVLFQKRSHSQLSYEQAGSYYSPLVKS